MNKSLIPASIVLVSLSALASSQHPVWSNPTSPPATESINSAETSELLVELQSALADNERRLSQVYRELQGAQSLLQQAGKALYRAQAEYQQSSRVQRMLGERVLSAAAARDDHNQRVAGGNGSDDWEIQRYRAFARNADEERVRLETLLETRDTQISELQAQIQALQAANAGTGTDLSAQVDLLKDELQTAREENSAIHAGANDLRQENHRQAQEIASLQSLLAGHDSQQVSLNRQLEESRAALAQAQETEKLSQAQLASLRDELQDTREKLQDTNRSGQEKIENLSATLAETRQDLAEARQQVLTSQENLLAANLRLDESRGEQIELTKALKTQQSQYAQDRRNLNDSLEVRDRLMSRLDNCNATLTRVRASFASVQPVAVETISKPEPASPRAELVRMGNQPSPSRAADTDGDGLVDVRDLCLQTPSGKDVGASGCEVNAPISLQGVRFRYDSAELTEASRSLLDKIADVLRRQPEVVHEVAGHTDAQGDASYNKWLSQQRANAVRDYLVNRGVDRKSLVAVGYGGDQPVGDNTTWEGLTANRRVELRWLP